MVAVLVFTCTALPPWPGDNEALIVEGRGHPVWTRSPMTSGRSAARPDLPRLASPPPLTAALAGVAEGAEDARPSRPRLAWR